MNSHFDLMDGNSNKEDNYFDRMDNHNHNQATKRGIKTNNKNDQRLAGSQLQAQQPHLAVKEDVIKNKNNKARARKEDAAPNEIF